VLGKFTVTFLFVALMMATSFIYPAMAIVQGGLGAQQLSALFLALLLHATALAAIGLACSAFSTSQLVAAVSAWAVGFVLWDFHWASAFLSEGLLDFLDRVALQPRYGSLAEGLVRLADFVYFAGVAAVGAALARFSFEWRRAVG
jgi:ABC-2 type transport system permease protein